MIAASLHMSVAKCRADPEFIEVYFEGKEEGKQQIIFMQYQLAMKGNADMLKWIGKNYVKQADKVDTTNESHVTIVISGDDKDL